MDADRGRLGPDREIKGRFPAYREEVPQAAVDYLGSLVKVEPALFDKYSACRQGSCQEVPSS